MFTFIISTRLELKDESTKVAMVLLAIMADFWLIAMILEGLSVIGK